MTEATPWHLERADALDAARRLAAGGMAGAFALIYLDPPFFTQRQQTAKAGAYTDNWGGNIGRYIDFLGERIVALRPLLAPEGSFLLHLDWHAVHYAKVCCDAIFGMENFQNEIVWAYNSGGGSKRRYGRKHDTILWYSTGQKAPIFNADAARVPYSAIIAKKREALFHAEGKVSSDVLSIARPPNHAAEWRGWPTQKPLALLEWFVRVHSRPGDRVGDFFCGSGTTLAAAVRHGRRGWGCDLSEDALSIARARLAEASPPDSSSDRTPSP
ncbi:MAG: site-specific DNA-methyltransferase [Sumerlaeia bacterium]